jgi:transposase
MKEIVVIGLDIAKSMFQVHGVDASGEPVVRRQLKRADEVILCGTFANADWYRSVRHCPLLGA